jgi:hypothetical protein
VGVARAAALLMVTRLLLLTLGFRRTHRILARSSMSVIRVGSFDRAWLNQQAERVAMISAFYPGRARCLEQSLMLWFLLRQRGVQAELRIGIQPYKVIGHAWVVVDGAPVGDSAEFVARFIAIPAPI